MLVLLSAGQTEAERDKVFLGRGVSPFTEEGVEQIKDAAETLSQYQISRAYGSDLYRAQETLRAIHKANRHSFPHTLVEELRERSGGSYEGKKYADLRVGMSPKQYKAWERDPFEPPLHGESLIDVEDRLRPWFESEITPRLMENETILIVSHPDTLRVLVCLARGDDMSHAVQFQVEQGMPYFYHPVPR